MQRLPIQLNDLSLATLPEVTIPSDYLNIPHIIQCPQLLLFCEPGLNNEQFLRLQATHMAFNSENITDVGINEFLMRWARGNGIRGFQEAHLWHKGYANSTMFEGLVFSEWDEEFKMQEWLFVADFESVWGNTIRYQVQSIIDPYESLTFVIKPGCIAIYHTGRRVDTRDGDSFTRYKFNSMN
uniref:FBA_2 domain-containing protein n=1 Tax=Caenorhabditis tropicalis TaxID=1561998 RepID=A0A1I7UUS9_9PELO